MLRRPDGVLSLDVKTLVEHLRDIGDTFALAKRDFLTKNASLVCGRHGEYVCNVLAMQCRLEGALHFWLACIGKANGMPSQQPAAAAEDVQISLLYSMFGL